ncbi:hypothetical protein BDR04DRAFT_1235684 [Suillus decipiens]|nr:hypothetical protein BDR04DRAFT_1235684 [Suillus decipiens]
MIDETARRFPTAVLPNTVLDKALSWKISGVWAPRLEILNPVVGNELKNLL